MTDQITDDSAQSKTETGYDASYFAPLAKLEDGHYWFEARKRAILYVLQKFKPSIDNFLEIGCGTGNILSAVSKAFPDADMVAADFFAEGLYFARQRVPDGNFFQFDARNIPFTAGFEVIGAFDVIEHIEEDERVLEEFYRILKTDGILLLTVPQHRFLWSVADEYKEHVRRYSRQDLVSRVEEAGYKIRYINSFISLIFPMMLASRYVQNQAKERPDRLTELDVHPLLNKTISMILQMETVLLKTGMPFPFGGSLLLVAQKQ